MPRTVLAATTAVYLALAASAAWAQDTAGQSDAGTALSEVVVTAQRRTENLQNRHACFRDVSLGGLVPIERQNATQRACSTALGSR